MARLLSPPARYGTYNGICVYRMNGEDLARAASSLTGERVKTEPEFKHTLAWAELLKAASSLGSAVYAMLPPWRRKHRLYRTLTGQAMRLLREGRSEGETVVELMISIQPKKRVRRRRTPRPATHRPAAPKPLVFHPAYHNPTPGIYLYNRKQAAFIGYPVITGRRFQPEPMLLAEPPT